MTKVYSGRATELTSNSNLLLTLGILVTFTPYVPEGNRTHDRPIKSRVLYLAELQALRILAQGRGFEPRFADSKSAVLPIRRPLNISGNKREKYIRALPLSYPSRHFIEGTGLEPATTRLSVEVTLLYATDISVCRGIHRKENISPAS